MIGNAGMLHAMDYAYKKFLSKTPNSTELALVYEAGRNVEEAEQMGKSLGIYAKEIIPMLKTVFESLFIVLSPMVGLLIFLPNNLKVMSGYAQSVIWVYTWDPVLAALNGIVNISAVAKLHTALQAGAVFGGLNMESYNTMVQTMDFVPAIAGFIGLSTPIHQEAAGSIESQRIASQTDSSFGSVEYSKYAESGAKLTALAFQRRAEETGRGDMFTSAYGHAVWDQARGMTETGTFRQYGFDMLKTGAKGNLEQGLAGGSAVHQFVSGQGMKELTDTSLTGLYTSAANAEVTRSRLGDGFDDYLTEARFAQAGSQAKMDMYRNGLLTPAQAVQVESRSVASTIGMQQKDIMKATALGFIKKGDVEQNLWGNVNAGLQAYKNWDGVAAKDMTEMMHAAGWTGVREGMRFNMEKGIGINQDTGNVDFLRGEIAGQTYSGKLEGNRLAQEYIDKNGFDVKTVMDAGTGRISHAEAVKVLDRETRIGNYALGAGTRVAQAVGEGGAITTYSGIINGKEGHLTIGADGRAVFADGRGGESFEQMEVDRKTVDTSTTVQSGFRSISLNERTAQGVFSIPDPNTGKVFTAQQVMDRGVPKWQYGIEQSQIGPDGKRIYSFNALNSRDVATGGYASHQTIGPDGATLHEQAKAGQDVQWYHQFKMNFEKGANVSVLGFVAPQGTDLTNLNSAQTSIIYAGGATRTAINAVGDAGRVLTLGKSSGVGQNTTIQRTSPSKAPQNIEVSKPEIVVPKTSPRNVRERHWQNPETGQLQKIDKPYNNAR